jgi:hypothetical protein
VATSPRHPVCQRFGGALNLNIHFHTLALDGVFILDPRTIRAILRSRGLPAGVADRAPPARSARAAAEAVPGVPA